MTASLNFGGHVLLGMLKIRRKNTNTIGDKLSLVNDNITI